MSSSSKSAAEPAAEPVAESEDRAVSRPAREVVDLETLQALEPIADLPAAELRWLIEHGTVIDVPAGELYVLQGDPARHMFLLLSGLSHWRVEVGNQKLLFREATAGSLGGVLPFSRMTHFGGEALAVEACRILRVAKTTFPEMVTDCPELVRRLVAEMSNRVRESVRVEQQREKMVSLGRLSAGLAHELNNPAAAIGRSADALRRRVGRLPERMERLSAHRLDPESLERMHALRETSSPRPLGDLERADREDALSDWLGEQGVDEPWMKAETLVAAGIDAEALEPAVGPLSADATADLLGWFESLLAADALLAEVGVAAERITDLVASIKRYSHRDRAVERQPVDLHRGLDDTLAILSHALRDRGVRLEREYDDALEPVPGYPGELNQVFTNLLANAIDAAVDTADPRGGRVRVETERRGPLAEIRVIDNGPGVPEALLERIYEPFFTTKEPGDGTGLGLDITRRIVHQHQGRLDCLSEPGHTVFRIRLPYGELG